MRQKFQSAAAGSTDRQIDMKILKSFLASPRKAVLVFSKDLASPPESVFALERGGSQMRAECVGYAPVSTVAAATGYYIENGYAHFVINPQNSPNACVAAAEEYYLCGSFNGWRDAVGNPQWRLSKQGAAEFSGWALKVPMDFFADSRKKYLFKFATRSRWLEPLRTSPNIDFDSAGNANLRFAPDKTGRNIITARFSGDFDFASEYEISASVAHVPPAPLDMERLLLNLDSAAPLGACVENGRTIFRVFAPRASRVLVSFRKTPESTEQTFEMRKSSVSDWVAEYPENLHGALYHYNVFGDNADSFTAFDGAAKVADPFALAMESPNGDGFVVDKSRLRRPSKRFDPPCWHDLSIMEIHLRDILDKAPCCRLDPHERLRFSGLTKWLKEPDCYLRECGVNCVELQPIQEFSYANASEYQWGYMPVNWFAPSSAYSSDPAGMSQHEDFLQLVEAFHDAGLAVILDVVYNHVGEPNFPIRLDKRYFFETDQSGALVNVSGCGNDFRADTPVGLKMIIDSLKNMIELYDIDGFRFDLAELLGVGVLRRIEREIKKVKPSAILIAEPWSFRGHIARSLKDTGFASWNDGFREFAREFVFDARNFDAFRYFMCGSYGGVASWPSQTVNYIESHDDKCFFDRISGSYANPSDADLRRYKIAHAFMLLSIGIPMVAEGFDLVRTKFGKNNTYLDGEANALDYFRGLRFSGTAQWLRGLMKFRTSQDARALRLADTPAASYFRFFKDADRSACAALFNADSSLRGAPAVFVAFNPSEEQRSIPLKDLNLKKFKQIADADRFCCGGLNSMLLDASGGNMAMPPLSVGVWIEKRGRD